MSTITTSLTSTARQADNVRPNRFVILADQSANWRVTGVRQLDRLFLAIREYSARGEHPKQPCIVVLWRPDIPAEQRWTPNMGPDTDLNGERAVVLTTRLLVNRNGLGEFVAAAPTIAGDDVASHSEDSWFELSNRVEAMINGAAPKPNPSWRYLSAPDQIARGERWLLRNSGKSQDGFVSRFLNRPLSAAASYVLLKCSVQPMTWTFASLLLPAAAFVFLVRGDYIGFVAGTIIFQIYSILDGCDGEIARARYIESEIGAKLDKWCDVFGGFVYSLGLGTGLYRAHAASPYAWLWVMEALVCIGVVAVNEWRLENSSTSKITADRLDSILYPRHRELIQHSGILFLGPKVVWWLVNLTKRDFSILVFLGLALVNQPEWILPLWIVTTAAVLALAAMARRRVERQEMVVTGGAASSQ